MATNTSDNPPTPTLNVLVKYNRFLFMWTLHTDGTGTLYDEDYGEKIDIEHEVDQDLINKIQSQGKIVDFTRTRYHTRLSAEGLKKIETTETIPVLNISEASDESVLAEDYEKLGEELSDLFYDVYNDRLENAVGTLEEPDGLTVENGTTQDFEEIMAELSIVWSGLHPEEEAYVQIGHQDVEAEYTCSEQLYPILDIILDHFEPNGAEMVYTDQNDGRMSSHYYSPTTYHLEGQGDAESSREIIGAVEQARGRLVELFEKNNIDTKILEALY